MEKMNLKAFEHMWKAQCWTLQRSLETKEKGYLTVLHGFPAPSTWKSASDSMAEMDVIFLVEDDEDLVEVVRGLPTCTSVEYSILGPSSLWRSSLADNTRLQPSRTSVPPSNTLHSQF